jgi:hypothetical protein
MPRAGFSRTTRASVSAGVVVALSLTAHVVAGGAPTGLAGTLLLFLFALIVCRAMLVSEPSRGRTVLAVVVGQLLLHTLMSALATGPVGPHAHHAGPDRASLLVGVGEPGWALMLASHVGASVAVGLWIFAGERLTLAVCSLLAGRLVRALTTRPQLVLDTHGRRGAAASARARTARGAVAGRQQVLARRVSVRRGPPAVHAAQA